MTAIEPSAVPYRAAYVAANAAENDNCSRAGSHELAHRIKCYWRDKCGVDLKVQVVDRGFHRSTREAIHELQSDTINGYPRAVYLRLKREACRHG